MGQYSIAETAKRTGFSTSALRYYDELGLVRPASRTEAGYRMYDDRGLERLAIVARVKRLGLNLDDARSVADGWEAGECADVQELLRTMVGKRLLGTQRDIAQRMALAADLQAAAEHLAGPSATGPCGPDCACATDAPAVTRGIPITPRTGVDDDEVGLRCTLEGSAMPGRMAEWQRILDRVTHRTQADGRLRLHFPMDQDLGAELGRLCVAEHSCCTFFAFTLTASRGSLTLDVAAPADAADLIATVFGVATPKPLPSTLEHR